MTKTTNIHQYCNTLASQHRKLMKKLLLLLLLLLKQKSVMQQCSKSTDKTAIHRNEHKQLLS